jgi:spermidine synthase/Tfp pilus assembly protein PilF
MGSLKTSRLTVAATAAILLSSAFLMMLEIVAGRLAARYIGSSLYTWTAVIGVTLGGLTAGNYAGGWLADMSATRKTIGWLFGIFSGSCIAAIALNNQVGEWSFLWRFGFSARVLLHIGAVFFIPSALMGAIYPVAVKMALGTDGHKGRTVGRMYALGAAGSILGTFLAGFWLIGTIGTVNTMWLIAAVMLAGAVIYRPRSAGMYVYAGLVAFVIIIGTASWKWAERMGSAISLRQVRAPELLYETESQYCYIAVRQLTRQPDERELIEDNMRSHSRVIMNEIRDLRFFYIQVYGAVTERLAAGKKKLCTLTIGGGGYVFPRYILDVWPGSQADVVEIDPAVTEAAKQAFGLPEHTTINTINLDGRNYVDELLERKKRGEQIPQYDFVYMDAFNDLAVPFQLVTRQFNEKIFDITASDGIYIINVITMLDDGRFFASYVRTIRETFPYVYAVTRQSPDDLPANFVVIAGKQPINFEDLDTEKLLKDTPLQVYDANKLAAIEKRENGIILDDDYAPVENLIAPVVRRSSEYAVADKYIGQAENLKAQGKWEQAVKKYKLAIQACPASSAYPYYSMGLILIEHGRGRESAEALRSAMKLIEKRQGKAIPFLYYELGVVLKNLGETAESSKYLAEAAELLKKDLAVKGNSAQTFWQLGQVQASSGNMKEATLSFEQALEQNPNDTSYYLSVAEALASQRQYEEGIEHLNKGIEYMLGRGRSEDANQLKDLRRRMEAEKPRREN